MDQNPHIEKQKKWIALGIGLVMLLVFPKLTVFAAFCAGLFFLLRQTKSPWVIVFLLLTPIVTLVFYQSIVMGSHTSSNMKAHYEYWWLRTWLQTLMWGAGLTGAGVGLLYLITRPRAGAWKDRTDLLATPEAAEKAVAMSRHQNGVIAGTINQQWLYASLEDRACVIGPPGAGKTAFMVTQIFTWAESKRPMVVLDIKPELWGITKDRLEEKGYRVLVFNPTEGCGQRYNPFDDAHDPEAIGELAAALIEAPEGDNQVFGQLARDFLDGIVTNQKALGKPASLPGLFDYLAHRKTVESVLKDLQASPSEYVRRVAASLTFTVDNERLMGAVFGSLASSLRFARYPAIAETLGRSEFTFEDFKGDKPVALFLQFVEARKELTGRLMAAMVGHLLRYLIAETKRPPVLLLLDEIGNADPVPGFAAKLNTIRSRNLPCWMFWQSKEQMQRYGQKSDEGPSIILGACDWHIVFRLNDLATAEWLSNKIGTVDRDMTTHSYSGLMLEERSKTRTLVTENRIKPHELMQLPDKQVVMHYRGHAFKATAAPYYEVWPEHKGKRAEVTTPPAWKAAT